MLKNDSLLKVLLLTIVLLLGVMALRIDGPVIDTVHAQTAQFDHVTIVSPLFLHKGEQGLLLLDKRNANVWFMPRRDGTYSEAQFLIRLPFEQLDRQPR